MDLNDPPTLKADLGKLADAIVPLSEWLAEPTKFIPTEQASSPLPWRKPGRPLNATALKVIPFLEQLLANDNPDEVLEKRWHELEADALVHCPVPSIAAWREARGLKAAAKFGAADSDNVVNFHEDMAQRPRKHTRSRSSFYKEFCHLFSVAVATKGGALNSAAAWKAFAAALLANNELESSWPVDAPPSSEFIKVFSRDILIAIMGMKNPLGDKDLRWDAAVLIELGEHRKRGNAYTTGQVNAATEVLKIKVRTVTAAKTPKV
jgi:hypothetical protein